MRLFIAFCAAGLCAVLSGCSLPLAPHQASLENLQALRSAQIGKVSVGEFRPAPGLPAEQDQIVSVRGLTLPPPTEGSFAKFLREALITELRTAGTFEPQATSEISGWLTDNRMEANGMKDQKAFLAARFTVRRGQSVVYDKELRTQAVWDADFVGISAAQSAIAEYTGLYRKLFGQLFADEDFRRAARQTD